MKVEDVLSCSFVSWYPKFKKFTLDSEVLKLPGDVLDYLLDTGTLVLPDSTSSTLPSLRTDSSGTSCSIIPDPNEGDNEEEWPCDQTASAKAPKLEEFSNHIKEAINSLGGSVFPKLNWTAPKDAAWMSYTNSLKCCFPDEIYLLLKSSNLLYRDLTQPFQDCVDESSGPIGGAAAPVLVLQRWREFNPSCEFRCFVRNKRFVGLCPRDVSQHYECLGVERSSIVADVKSFWRENVENRFPLHSYVFDVVRLSKDRVLLLDFAPLHQSRTNSLLFEWDELLEPSLSPRIALSTNDALDNLELEISDELQLMNLHNTDSNRASEAEARLECSDADDTPEFRYINQEIGVQPSHDRLHGMPVDFLDCAQDPNKLMDLFKLQVQSTNEAPSSSEDEGNS